MPKNYKAVKAVDITTVKFQLGALKNKLTSDIFIDPIVCLGYIGDINNILLLLGDKPT